MDLCVIKECGIPAVTMAKAFREVNRFWCRVHTAIYSTDEKTGNL